MKILSRNLKRHSWEEKTGKLDLSKDGRKAWTLLDRLSGKAKKTNPVPIETENGKATTDTKKADAFNRFFSSTKNKRRGNLDQAFKTLTRKMENRTGPFQSIFIDPFSTTELEDSLNKCKLKKAPGPDKVSNDMIVQLSKQGKTFLLNLINKTWRTGKLPKIWNSNRHPDLKERETKGENQQL